MSAMRSLAMKKKIALLMTFAVCVIGAAAWFIVYSAQRGSAVEGARDTLGRYLTVAMSSAEREGLAGLAHAEKVWQEMYPDGRMTVIASDGPRADRQQGRRRRA